MIHNLIKRYFTIVKFLIAGGTATAIDLALLYYFTDILMMWYLTAAVLAFMLAFGISFVLQKFWTFSGLHARRKREQIPMYLALNLFGLCVNSLGMYFLVDKFGLWHMAAQVIMAALIAVFNFFVYRLVIFRFAENGEEIDILNPVDTQ
jgi:putative flippase GtrA